MCLCDNGHVGVDNAKGCRLIALSMWILDAVGFKLMNEAPLNYSLGLGVQGSSGIREAVQEVGFHYLPLRLRNQLFPKSFQAFLGIMSMSDSVSLHLEDINSSEG